jgi:acyl-CoA synthetase (AMP-forming)/AMP-acid ligase II
MNWSYVAERNAKDYPERDALVYEGRRITYRSLNERVNAVAKGLLDYGVKKGDIVAIHLYNCPEYAELTFAINKVGAIWLPVNWRFTGNELVYILNHSQTKILISEMEFYKTVASIKDQLTSVKQFIAVGKDVPLGWASYDDIVERNLGVEVPHVSVELNDLQRLMYTSGTTAYPKGAMITYGNVYWKCMAHIITMKLSRDERALITGPMYHVGGMDLPLTSVMYLGGATAVILRRFVPVQILEAIQKEKITALFAAPAMLNVLFQEPTFESYDVSSLRIVIDGAEKIPLPVVDKFARLFPTTYLLDGYGLTETVAGVSYMPLDRDVMTKKAGAAGKPIIGVRIRIVDDNGKDVPRGSSGEIVLKGGQVFKGYWRSEEATAEAIKDGWFYTGDIGYFDEEGYLWIVDRKKDMIKSGGENIASAEVERVIYELPQVFETAVVGIPHPKWLEVPKAFIVLKEGQTLTEQDIIEHCTLRLAKYKVPKEIQFISALPRNPSGKVLKRDLRKLSSPAGG